MPTKFTDADGLAFLQIPADFVVPETDMLVQDARATLLHNLTLFTEAKNSGVLVSPIWENREGQASLRAALVPPQIVARYFEGRGLASLRDATVLEMVADVVPMLLEQPAEAAAVLEGTHQLWVAEEAPIRGLQIPFKGHFKLLTLLLADLARKVSAGFGELEWLTSIGLLDAFHDPASDPPADDVKNKTAELLAKMHAEEAEWMQAFVAHKS